MRLARLRPEDRDALIYVCANMREWDRREIFATRWDDDPAALADDCFRGGEFSYLFGTERPIGIIGAIPLWRGVWSVYMFATDEFLQVGLPLTKWVRRVMIPALTEDMGCHRAQCHSIEGHTDAQRWLEANGVHREAPARGYGRNGEDFWVYAWTRRA
jgi:hypothetical protein